MFLSADDAKSLLERALSRSRADACVVSLSGGESQSLRFARGAATTNMANAETTLRVASHVGERIGSIATATLDDAAIAAAVARSEEIARLLPVDPDYVAPLGPQHYESSRRYDEATGILRLDALAEAAGVVIAEGARRGVETFGYAASGRRFEAMATSAGLFAYDRMSEIELSVTARNRADTWSGWAGAHEIFARKLDAADVARRACDKGAFDVTPVDLEPGAYTVILEPAATAELMIWLMRMLDARAADEGRSFFSAKGGATRLRERVFDAKLTLRSDPGEARAPEGAIGYEGVPQRPRAWIDAGVVSSLYRSRAWAQKTGAEAVPGPRHFAAAGGATTLEEMIRATKRGVLVTRLWYTNMVEPRGLLLTGLTRDGNFLIENGRIVAPARNLRFNQSLADLFARIEALGSSDRTLAGSGEAAVAAPAMLVDGFNFSSKSSGI